MTQRLAYLFLLISLIAQLEACGQADSVRTTTWEDQGCDSTQSVGNWSVYDAVIPFRLADSLRATLKVSPRVYFTVWQDTTLQRWAVVGGQIGDTARQVSVPSLEPSLLAKQQTLDWIDVTYLWSLADSHEYLYNRWEPLLRDSRRAFVEKREATIVAFQAQKPNYQAKVISDLRTAVTQGRYLLKGASAAPVSHHQLGLASDFAIIYQKRYQRNVALYRQLGELGKSQGLTWGGGFVGFVDPPHLQMFYNSAELVQRFPALRFEFEPYRYFYLKKVRKKIAEGKEAEVLDTEQLLTALNQLRKAQPCTCERVQRGPVSLPTTTLSKLGYVATNDILLIANAKNQTVMMVHPSGNTFSFRVGRWR